MAQLTSNATPQKLVWLEGLRILAAVAILLYHAQLYFTDYAYTPQPTGLLDNLQRIGIANSYLGQHWLLQLLAIPIWFGFQFVDVFVLISGFVTVISLKGQPLRLGQFYQRRLLRILLPFWTVAWLGYPVLWALGEATNSYVPDPWHSFVGATFPLFFQYDAQLLLPTSGPWWFVPLILSLVLVFPLLWWLLRRWGARNLLIVSLLVAFSYRAVAVFCFGGHPTYVSLETPAGWSPFLSLLAKIDTFVCGMAAAQLYLQRRGLFTWQPTRLFWLGLSCYSLGFWCQFSRAGWIAADLLVSIGLTTCCMVLFRYLERFAQVRQIVLGLGSHSYSYFLIHNFVVDRSINLVIGSNLLLYWGMLPIMAIGTLIFSVVADYTTPLIRRIVLAFLQDLDYVLTTSPERQVRTWNPNVGDRVRYRGESGWTVLKVERLLDDKELCLCQVSDGYWMTWLSAEELEPDRGSPADLNGRAKVRSIL
jgi:peptidoglycan/LPS O-acetylase OafA/YrhL